MSGRLRVRRRARLIWDLVRRGLPSGLYWRTMLIFLVPVALMQLAIIWVFFDVHWERTTERMTEAAAAEVSFLLRMHEGDPTTQALDTLAGTAERTLGARIAVTQGLSNPGAVIAPSWEDRIMVRMLRATLSRPFGYIGDVERKTIVISAPTVDGVMRITLDRGRALPSRSYQFLVAVVLSTILLTAISLLFIRNQVRPIEQLAAAAEAFGTGREPVVVRAWGAREVRRAWQAVLDMHERITRHVDQRTQLLAGVSHDLRTPITRLKLQFALMEPGPDLDAMKRDLEDMEYTLDEYLDFARGVASEDTERVDLVSLLREEAAKAQVVCTAAGSTHMDLRAGAIRRALGNLISNARSHGERVQVGLALQGPNVLLLVDDDGPGVPEAVREEVFKPFVRLDPARNRNRKGVGLGLAIVRDVARAHGGDAYLQTSPLGGLRAVIALPLVRKPVPRP